MEKSEKERLALSCFLIALMGGKEKDRDELIRQVGDEIDDYTLAEKVYWAELYLKMVAPGRTVKLFGRG